MFSPLASLLALVPLLVHSVLGCCWHHAHESAGGTGETKAFCEARVDPATHAHHASADCHGHGHHRDLRSELPGEPPPLPCPHSSCDEERCVIASTSFEVVPQMVAAGLATPGTFMTAVELPNSVCSSVAARHEWRECWLSHSPSQGRALTQVWLI